MLAFAHVALLRLVRDRTNVFFVLLFPLLIVMLIGLQFSGGGATRVGVVDGLHADAVRAELVDAEVDLELVDLTDAAAARAAVEAGDVDAALVFPASSDGGTDEVQFIANPDGSDLAVRSVVQAAVAAVDTPLRAARTLAGLGLVAADAASDVVAAVPVSPVAITTVTIGEGGLDQEFAGLGQFDLGASTQLLLFVFITAMTGSAAVVQARRWGVLDRVLAGPTAPGTVVAGLALGQLAVAGVQALVIVAATSLLFDVNWGDPVAASAVVVLFSLVAAAAGLLFGALLRNEEQVGGLGVPISLAAAAIGGCMVPLELFPDPLRAAANLTPHAWGNLAFAEIVRRDGGLLDVLPQLGVLALFAVVLGVAAATALRRRLAIES